MIQLEILITEYAAGVSDRIQCYIWYFSGNIRTILHAIICKYVNRYMNSFFTDAITSGNIFMEIINYKDVPSIDVIKNAITSLTRPKSIFFQNL